MAEIARLQGVEGLARRLRKLPKAVRRKHANKALRAGLRPMIRSARAEVPTDTGLLKRNIKSRTVPAKALRSGARVQLGVKVDRSGRKTGTDAFYWRFVEFGTANMGAQPFLRPAFERNKHAAARIIKEGLLKGVATEARKR